MTTMKERLRDPRFTGPRFWSAAALAFALATTACATGPKTVDPATSSLIKGDAAALGFDAAKLGDIRTALNADVMSGKIPGAYLLIGRKGQIAFSQGFGVQGPGQTTPARRRSIASSR